MTSLPPGTHSPAERGWVALRAVQQGLQCAPGLLEWLAFGAEHWGGVEWRGGGLCPSFERPWWEGLRAEGQDGGEGV